MRVADKNFVCRERTSETKKIERITCVKSQFSENVFSIYRSPASVVSRWKKLEKFVESTTLRMVREIGFFFSPVVVLCARINTWNLCTYTL